MDDIRTPRIPSARPERPIQHVARRPAAQARRAGATAPAAIHSPSIAKPAHHVQQHASRTTKSAKKPIVISLRFQLPSSWLKIARRLQKHTHRLTRTRTRLALLVIIGVLVLAEIVPFIQPHFIAHSYAMASSASSLLPEQSSVMAAKIKYDAKEEAYNFNAGYVATNAGVQGKGGAKITAKASVDASKGITTTDPVSNIAFTLKPQFPLQAGRQEGNRIVYPLSDGTGWLVYSMQAGQVKENVILTHANGDRMKQTYNLDLGSNLAARILSDGSVGIFGNTLLSGNVSTGSSKDAALLEKARQNAPKNTLLFKVPAPVVKETNRTNSKVESHYELKGSELSLVVKGLKKATYPLAIDPSVYVTSAQQFMQGNNETNVDFDTSNDLIQKGKLTGARIPSWTSTVALITATPPAAPVAAPRWGSGYGTGGGFEYVVGGNNGTTNQKTVLWAQFDPTSNAIITPANCTNWCTNTAFDLPNARTGLSTVVYNGYLYAIGGSDSGTCATTNNICNTVYVAKLSANGEPISWATTSSLILGRSNAGIVAYNNKIYILGGQTTTATTGINGDATIESASVNPDGTLAAWATSGTGMPGGTALWGETALQYNGYIYVVGGASTSTAATTINYIKVLSTGALASTWVSTSAFSNARMTFGGNFATIYGGYVYITTGCATLTTTSCTAMTSTTNDFQYASINADGSLTNFTATSTNLTSAMTGYGLSSWRGALYAFGGCTAVSAIQTCSGTAQNATYYGAVNTDGDISGKVVTGAVPPSVTPFALNAPGCRVANTDCDLPPPGTSTTQGGRMSGGTAIYNGYIYYIGGCIQNDCTAMSNHTSYAAISSTGTMVAPGTCVGTISNSIWCVDSTHTIPTAIGAFAITTFNGSIIIYGGYSGGATQNNFYVNTLNGNGSLGTWTTTTGATATMPSARAYSFMFARANSATAGTGYLYVLGGCTGGTGVGCSGYVAEVQRCVLSAVVAPSGCAITGQLQLDGDPNTALAQGLGISAGALYGNYIYLAGGASGATSTTSQQGYVFYAKIDTNYNIVDPTSGHGTWPFATTDAAGTGGVGLASKLTVVRRRSSAFVVNSYLYVVGGHDGTLGGAGVTLTDIQIGKIDPTTGNIVAFSQLKNNAGGTSIIAARWDLRTVAANGYLYMIGGCTSGYPPANCDAGGTSPNGGTTGVNGMDGVSEYVQVYNNWSASPAVYTAASNQIPTDRQGASAAILNGFLYVAGGCTGTTECATTINNVSFAALNADGSIGTWNTSGTYALPQSRAFGRLEAVGGNIYYLGGQTGTAGQTSVYYTAPDPTTGIPPGWTTSGTVLPAASTGLAADVYNGRIYISGGATASNGAGAATVYFSPDLSAGGNPSSWTPAASFTLGRSGHSMVAYGNYLYILGGFDGTGYLLDVQYALINSDGTIGTWAKGTSLPQLVRQGDVFATNGFLYIFGGRSATTVCTNNTYDVPVNANGSIGNWSQTNVNFPVVRYGVAAAYSGGRAYLVGGACGATEIYGGATAQSTIYGTLQLQPQLANYSIEINTDVDVTPIKYLMNGVDSGIGASWYLKYISSLAATNSWGLSTNVGKLTLGTPGTYTPVDGAGANTTFSQYHMFFLTIDDQLAFGYPEDVTRGPNIRDITLEFSANPSKRLRNGKTFTGGVQQPLDTPF